MHVVDIPIGETTEKLVGATLGVTGFAVETTYEKTGTQFLYVRKPIGVF
jgi:hypothetical protein